jgi:hypothetical protein
MDTGVNGGPPNLAHEYSPAMGDASSWISGTRTFSGELNMPGEQHNGNKTWLGLVFCGFWVSR